MDRIRESAGFDFTEATARVERCSVDEVSHPPAGPTAYGGAVVLLEGASDVAAVSAAVRVMESTMLTSAVSTCVGITNIRAHLDRLTREDPDLRSWACAMRRRRTSSCGP